MRYSFVLLLLLLFSCGKESFDEKTTPLCTESVSRAFSPIGDFVFQEINDVSGCIKASQFVTAEIGFILSPPCIGNQKIILHKTDDGGQHWTKMEWEDYLFPNSLLFVNEQEGYISFGTANSNLLITQNGGLDWEAILLENLPSSISNLQADSNGHLYGLIQSEDVYTDYYLVKSTNGGYDWEIIYNSYALQRSGFHSYTIVDNSIYALDYFDNFVILDLEGAFEKMIYPGVNSIFDFHVFDHDTLLIIGDNQLLKTTNGGISWTVISEVHTAMIIEPNTSNDNSMVLLVQTAELCQEDGLSLTKDFFVLSRDKGKTWIESDDYTRNLFGEHYHLFEVSPDFYVMVHQTKTYYLKR